MSQLRENSKSGFGRHKDETHVLSPPQPVPSTTSTTIISTTGRSVNESSLSSVSISGGQDGKCINLTRKNNNSGSSSSADIHSDMEISIQIPRPTTQTTRVEGSESERGCSSSSKNSVSVCVEGDDNDHDEENENDSDPPVENYNLFRLDFQGQEDREDDRYPDDGLLSNVSPMGPMTIEEQRQHQKNKAQSQHRKRKKSVNSNNNVDGNYIPPYRKRFRRSVLPSKFLLGGNIRDPLNLASLADAKVNAALNAETPKSSPVPIPLYRHGEVPVFIPKNPDDPLGLKSEAENPYDFIAGIRKNSKARKHRHRKKGGRKRTNSECSVDKSEDSDGKDTKDKDSSVSSEEEKTKSVVEKSTKPIKTSKSEPSVFAMPTSAGSSVKVKEAEITITEKQDQVEKSNKKIESSEPVIPVKAESSEVPLSKEKTPIVKNNDSGEIDVTATAGPSSKLPMSAASTVADAPATSSKSIQTVSGEQGQVAGAPSATKKKPRHRRRVRKYGGRPGGQFVPTGYFLSAKTSDYVPLGTPSVHEPNYWYSNYTPNYTPNSGGHDRYQYDVHTLPFESPSLANYFSNLETLEPGSGGVKSPVANVMEPFSPPPKQEAKRRRIELATGTEPAAAIVATTTRTSVDTPVTTTASTSSSSSNKKPEPVQPLKIKPSGVQTSVAEKTVKADSANFLRPNPPSRLLTRANFRRRFRHKADPIVSPVIPQPGCRRRFSHYGHGHHNNHSNCNHHGHHGHKKPSGNFNIENNIAPVGGRRSQNLSITPASEGSGRTSGNSKSKPEPVPRFRKKDEMFQYGNYNRYYGYRGSTDGGNDLRLKAFPKEFFYGKDILDVGCNIGHVTLTIARDFGAKVVTGMDIDSKLIQVAKKNIKHYVDRDPADETIRFPHSCPTLYGVLQPPPGTLGDTRKIPFPYNVSFKHENYVLESDEMLETVKPEYDIILCLSISKWIHLNYGDDGLKRFFRRVYRHLRPGGKLVLEPQPWSSYRKKKSLTERIYTTYKSIKLFPDKFHDYLLGEVGFSTLEKLQTPAHHSKGFQRPLMIFTKANNNDITANTVHDGSSSVIAADPGAELDKDMNGGVGMDVVPHPSSEQHDQNSGSVTAETSEAVAATSSSLPITEGDSDSRVSVPVSSSTITSSTLKPDSGPDNSETCAITNTNESSSAGMLLPSSSS